LGIMNAGSWVARRRPVAVETTSARRASGPRFERFAAAMQAMPPPSEQMLPEAGRSMPPASEPSIAEAVPRPPSGQPRPAAYVQEGPAPAPGSTEAAPTVAPIAAPTADASAPMPHAGSVAATTVPRRPVVEDRSRVRGDVPWLGIGSWLLLCGALFASLVGWPGQTAVDRLTSAWSNGGLAAILGRAPAEVEPTPAPATPGPARDQDWSAMSPGTQPKPEALPPLEVAPPIPTEGAGDTAAPADAGPPLPRFKPRVDRVAAEFSSAFFEIGERLQREGDFDAALHMRRQGSNLDPWKDPFDRERRPSG
jgi:hypothetical protein